MKDFKVCCLASNVGRNGGGNDGDTSCVGCVNGFNKIDDDDDDNDDDDDDGNNDDDEDDDDVNDDDDNDDDGGFNDDEEEKNEIDGSVVDDTNIDGNENNDGDDKNVDGLSNHKRKDRGDIQGVVCKSTRDNLCCLAAAIDTGGIVWFALVKDDGFKDEGIFFSNFGVEIGEAKPDKTDAVW
ncbi:hypothetical protein ElyMa_004812800 [Elysia marginata]|uniref:Uncharacterized protein n=1 Tax=Elysia marginata TaxID=1093978 RepID=A0AAV4IPX3_9GAST|nr:hypothetical protein ElyMa_004812800 [Elysia marginata]